MDRGDLRKNTQRVKRRGLFEHWGQGGGSKGVGLHDSSVQVIYRCGSSDFVNDK